MDPGGGGPLDRSMFFLKEYSTRLGGVETLLAKARGRLEEQSEKIEALEKAVDGLESSSRLLKNEWLDVLDRANRVMGRLTARIRKFESQNGPESDVEEVEKGPLPGGVHGTLVAMRRRRGVLSG